MPDFPSRIEKVSLSEVTEDDLPFLHSWLNDSDAFGRYDEAPLSSMDVIRNRWIAGAYRGALQATWIIRVEDTRVGYCNFAVHPWDDWVGVIGVIIARTEWRGRGVGTQVHHLLSARVFAGYPVLEKLEAITDVENAAERRVLEKSGFRNEGTLRWRNRIRGELRDMCFYGKLRPEWERELER